MCCVPSLPPDSSVARFNCVMRPCVCHFQLRRRNSSIWSSGSTHTHYCSASFATFASQVLSYGTRHVLNDDCGFVDILCAHYAAEPTTCQRQLRSIDFVFDLHLKSCRKCSTILVRCLNLRSIAYSLQCVTVLSFPPFSILRACSCLLSVHATFQDGQESSKFFLSTLYDALDFVCRYRRLRNYEIVVIKNTHSLFREMSRVAALSFPPCSK